MTNFKDVAVAQYLSDLEMLQIKMELTETILALPNNHNITKISSQCFIMSSAHLSRDLCLTPEYYNFERQYKLIVKVIEECSTKRAQSLMNDIVSKGSIHYPSGTYHRFHPDVIKQVNLLLDSF